MVHFSNGFWQGKEAIRKRSSQNEIVPVLVIFSFPYSKYRGVKMFLFVSLSKLKFFNLFALISLVQHQCRTHVVSIALVFHSCCTHPARVLLLSHSCCLCCTCVAFVLLASYSCRLCLALVLENRLDLQNLGKFEPLCSKALRFLKKINQCKRYKLIFNYILVSLNFLSSL